jgi:hypothetical protein
MLLLQKKEVRRKNNEVRRVVALADNQNSQPLNWLSRHSNQDQDDARGFLLLVWDMKQRLVAVAGAKEGSAHE